jgi:hypothetical protein
MMNLQFKALRLPASQELQFLPNYDFQAPSNRRSKTSSPM